MRAMGSSGVTHSAGCVSRSTASSTQHLNKRLPLWPPPFTFPFLPRTLAGVICLIFGNVIDLDGYWEGCGVIGEGEK